MKKIIIAIAIIGLVVGATYNKAHKTRECEILGVYENMMSVVHPNGRIYTLSTDGDCTGRYRKGEIVDVVFDELHEWDTQYECIGLKQ